MKNISECFVLDFMDLTLLCETLNGSGGYGIHIFVWHCHPRFFCCKENSPGENGVSNSSEEDHSPHFVLEYVIFSDNTCFDFYVSLSSQERTDLFTTTLAFMQSSRWTLLQYQRGTVRDNEKQHVCNSKVSVRKHLKLRM